MFNQIFDAIEEWMRELLTGMISSNLDRMFTDVNQKTSEIAGQVGQTPQVSEVIFSHDNKAGRGGTKRKGREGLISQNMI